MPGRAIATPPLRAAILAGAATGMRSTFAVAALISRRSSGLPTWLVGRPAGVVAPLAVTGELIMDKLPSTPSRLDSPGLAGRASAAALAGAVIARGTGQPQLLEALVASAAALASARICHDLRVALSERLPPCAVAAGEDGLAFALAAAAAGGDPS
jgi:uncharacterized membrane protein